MGFVHTICFEYGNDIVVFVSRDFTQQRCRESGYHHPRHRSIFAHRNNYGVPVVQSPQAKVGGIGGLVILLLVLFVIPVGRETNVSSPQPEISYQEQVGHTGSAELDLIIDAVLAGNPVEELQLLQFSTLACTHADGLGGPPKCGEGEDEGTKVDVFPFLGPEGHHMRRDEMGNWGGVQGSEVYAVYRNSSRVYSEDAYPAGEYAIVFLTENAPFYLTIQVTDGKIVRIDNNFGNPADIDLGQVASEIILPPQQ